MKFLKYFTFLSLEEIDAIAKEFAAAPEGRQAQKALAKEVTTLVHGQAAYEQAVHISEALFNGNIKDLSADEVAQGFKGVPNYQVQAEDDLNLVEILVTAGIESSKRQAREDIQNGAISVNGERRQDVAASLTDADKLGGRYTVIRRGKKKYFLLVF